jgi:cold shock CspA family protein
VSERTTGYLKFYDENKNYGFIGITTYVSKR